MKKNSASSIVDAVVSLDASLDKLRLLILDIDDTNEKALLIRALGEVVQNLTGGILFHVLRQYPELDPDR